MHRLNSSLRVAAPEQTLVHAKEIATGLGISRVTNITRLDRIGIPVFASVRPCAQRGSLCVNAGKGVTSIEAEIGAYMEAIEFAVAESAASREIVIAAPKDLLGGIQSGTPLSEFCPMLGVRAHHEGPIECVLADDLISGSQVLVPAELVFLPYAPRQGSALFGSNSNGLASGNAIAEATLHALLELIERDVASFHYMRNRSRRLLEDSLPAEAHQLIDIINASGLKVCLRDLPNEFGVPTFSAHLFDPASIGGIALSAGFGCHLIGEIALIRAIIEAVQSRLSAIHGGRDDLDRAAARFAKWDPGEPDRHAALEFQSLMNSADACGFHDASLDRALPGSIDGILELLIERLLSVGIQHVCRVSLTKSSGPLHVVRVVVPRLEFFEPQFPRVGARLLRYIHAQVT
jgi:YcaO-like protein with predicted kinase domain